MSDEGDDATTTYDLQAPKYASTSLRQNARETTDALELRVCEEYESSTLVVVVKRHGCETWSIHDLGVRQLSGKTVNGKQMSFKREEIVAQRRSRKQASKDIDGLAAHRGFEGNYFPLHL